MQFLQASVFLEHALEDEIGLEVVYRDMESGRTQDRIVDLNPVLIPDPIPVILVGLLLAADLLGRKSQPLGDLPELLGIEAIAEMGGEPHRGKVFGMHPGPAHRNRLEGTDMVRVGGNTARPGKTKTSRLLVSRSALFHPSCSAAA